MSYNLKQVKEIIQEFLKGSLGYTRKVKENEYSSLDVNKAIFDIESYLVELRKEHQLNERIDTSISSHNILKHFHSIEAKDAFAPADYQLNFLYHLATNHQPDKDLYTLIDEFIEAYKEQFKLADIVITKSGATRCKTNMRFAVNDLRDLGLVLSRDAKNQRSWEPSIMGLIILLNIQLNLAHFQKEEFFKSFNSLRPVLNNKPVGSRYEYDPILFESITMFKEPTYLYEFLNEIRYEVNQQHGDAKIFEHLIDLYIDFVQKGLKITPDGIRITEDFEKQSNGFQSALFTFNSENKILYTRLCKCLKKEI